MFLDIVTNMISILKCEGLGDLGICYPWGIQAEVIPLKMDSHYCRFGVVLVVCEKSFLFSFFFSM